MLQASHNYVDNTAVLKRKKVATIRENEDGELPKQEDAENTILATLVATANFSKKGSRDTLKNIMYNKEFTCKIK